MRDRSASCGPPRRRREDRSYDDYLGGKQDRPREAWSRDSRYQQGRGSQSSRGAPRPWREQPYRERERFARGDGRHRSRDSHCGRGGVGADIELVAPCIWVGGCPKDVTERELARVCAKFGQVTSVAIKHSDRDTFAFVGFERMREAKDAIRGLDQVSAFGNGIVKVAPANRKARPDDGWPEFRGRELPLPPPPRGGDGRWPREQSPRQERRSRSRRPAVSRPVRVYLSQLPRDMEEDELQEIAAAYGKVLQYELHREGAYKCGWVEYASKGEAAKAVSELDERRMDEWTMRLQAYLYPGGET
mmetsp:Transcript_19999/g.40619  ORF Transcript_19999/g.40619 Transcript_19999/m.40619 type:complete len:303 (-) Transcript_19999:29-937(-)